MPPEIFILTYCKDEKYFSASTLIFETLRVGFPSAIAHVIDNASLPHLRMRIKDFANRAGASFTSLEVEIPHHAFLRRVVDSHSGDAVVFVDPDICFWRCVESWSFEGLLAGSAIPCFRCDYSKCITHRRLHTSFLWLPQLARLRGEIRRLQQTYIDFDPFRPIMFNVQNQWYRFDTCGTLCSALAHHVREFTGQHRDAFDHLFSSSHGDQVAQALRPDVATQFERLHRRVALNYHDAKGAWRLQDAYIQSRSVTCCPRFSLARSLDE